MATNTIGAGVVLNEGQIDVDFRVEGNNNANVLMVDGGNDRVGIGTASPNTSLEIAIPSPGEAQGVKELLRLFNAGTGGGTGAAIDFYHGGPNKNARIRSYATGVDEGDLYFEPANGTNFATVMMLDGSTGNVGIGTATIGSNQKLTLYDDGGGGYASIGLQSDHTGTGNTQGSWIGLDNDTEMSLYIWNYEDKAIRFGTNGTDRMRIDSDGNVGIGVTAPDQKVIIGATGGVVMNIISDTDANSADNDALIKFSTDGTTESASTQKGTIGYDQGDDIFTMGYGDNPKHLNIDSTGAITAPLQPAFLARPTSKQSNFATGGVTVVFGTETFDQGGNFASNTFTAPITGRYQLSVGLWMENLDTAGSFYYITLVTSNGAYYDAVDPSILSADAGYWTLDLSVLADMDASDTAYITVTQGAGTAQTDIETSSYFSGYLVC